MQPLEAYVHWKLTGQRVLGIGDAAGMFPIDTEKKDYNQSMVDKFDGLVAPYRFSWKLRDIMPKVLVAGQDAGYLSEEGAKLLDVSGKLKAGIPMCPPEEMQVPAWWPPTVWRDVPEMSLREPLCLP